MQRLGQTMWAMLTLATACTKPTGQAVAEKPIPLEVLAHGAEQEFGAMLEVLDSERPTRVALGAVNATLVTSGLARGLPSLPAPEDAEACFRDAAASRGLEISSIQSQVPELVPPADSKLKPGQRWQVKRDDLLGRISVNVVVNGPLPAIASMIDEIALCKRLVAVRTAKVQGSTVRLAADAWFERNLAAPELDVRWRSLDERLTAAGWKPDDPALAKDPAYARLKAAVDAGRGQLPRARNLMKTGVELPRWITRARELITLKQEIMQIRGGKLLGLSPG